jgi:hypothetical protein
MDIKLVAIQVQTHAAPPRPCIIPFFPKTLFHNSDIG